MAQLRCAHICTATEGHAAPVTRDLECALADLDTPDDPGAITPTDPILAASVIGRSVFARKSVPLHIRELLTAESGCGDPPHATAPPAKCARERLSLAEQGLDSQRREGAQYDCDEYAGCTKWLGHVPASDPTFE